MGKVIIMADMRHPDDPRPRRTETRIQPQQNGAVALLIIAALVLIGLVVWGLNRSTDGGTTASGPTTTTSTGGGSASGAGTSGGAPNAPANK